MYNLRNRKIIAPLFVLILAIISLQLKYQLSNVEKYQARQLNHINELCDAIDKCIHAKTELKIDAYLHTRLKLKKCEAIISYLNQMEYDGKINAAPLFKPDRAAPSNTMFPPLGFQVLDELFYADSIDFVEIDQQLFFLKSAIKKESAFIANIKIEEYMIYEVARQEMIRMLALGITGFDRPSGESPFNENALVLSTLAEDLAFIDNMPSNKEMHTQLVKKLVNAALFLGNKNYDNFDYAYFIKTFHNPIFKEIKDLQIANFIETPDERTFNPLPTNYSKDYLFSEDFINPYFFSGSGKDFKNKNIIDLGEKLFYDKQLSNTKKMNCESCHQPNKGFSDGLSKKTNIARNSMGLWNSCYSEKLFWDLRTKGLENQVEHVFTNKFEYNTSYAEIIKYLASDSTYKLAFNNNFNSTAITASSIGIALGAYVNSLRGYNSVFDSFIRNEKSTLNANIISGFNLFMGKASCATCHFVPTFAGLVPPLFIESEAEVLGVTITSKNKILDKDLGRWNNNVPQDYTEYYKNMFKTVTVRNSGLTAPYMHNGGYKTLQEVLIFYNNGGGAGMGLNLPHQTLSSDSLHLSKKELKELELFIISLNHTTNGKKVKVY